MGVRLFAIFTLIIASSSLWANYLDDIGVTDLKALDPSVRGSGVKIAIVEADEDQSGTPPYKYQANYNINPNTVFKYYDTLNPWGPGGTGGTTYNQAISGSSHADVITGMILRSDQNQSQLPGVAPGISEVRNVLADYFFNYFIYGGNGNIDADIIHQSFVFNTSQMPDSSYKLYTYYYDKYANNYGSLFVNGVANSQQSKNLPGGMYNGISVGVMSGNHSNPIHVVTTVGQTSESTALVSGAAALLIDTARKPSVGASDDSRVIKSVILTGATKTTGWSQTAANPLDANMGAGVLNVANSYKILTSGQMSRALTNTQNAGTINTNPAIPNNAPEVVSQAGWDLNTVTNSGNGTDTVVHYLLDLTDPTILDYNFTATLTWNSDTTNYLDYGIKNLDLILLNLDTHTVVAQSISTLENVEHLYLSNLASGRYDIQVILREFTSPYTETYGLSFNALPFNTVPIPEAGTAAMLIFTALPLLAHRRRRK